MSSIKIAQTQYPVIDVIKNRWSARAFADKSISTETLNTIFEAASWAASAMNEQPWHYSYAHRGTPGFERIWNCLMGGNQPWAKNAAALVVSMARKTYQSNQKENHSALHDLGMANAHFLLQATSMNLYCHQMGGFEREMLIKELDLSSDLNPVCVIAIGYLDSPETLIEPFKTREITGRKRRGVEEFTEEIK